jgi:hypothetical protein
MQFTRDWFRRLTWVALVAILALALVPTLSRALVSSAAAGPWSDICSIDGAKAVAAGSGAGGGSEVGASHLDHCPLCAAATGPGGLPPSVAVHALPLDGGLRVVPRQQCAPRPRHAGASTWPRGPPSFS